MPLQMPRRTTKVFTLLETIYELGGAATFDQVFEEIGNLGTRQGNNYEMKKMFDNLIEQNYAYRLGEKYRLTEESKNYVETILKMEGTFKPKNLVQPAYKNIFTPAIKNYTQSLFANKRGYENGFE